MKCNKYYQIVDGADTHGFLLHIAILTAAIINNEEQEPKALASMDGLVVREIVGDETGIGKVITDVQFEDGVLTIDRTEYPANKTTFIIRGKIGNTFVDATIVVNLTENGDYEYDLPDYVVKYVSDGAGGGDYKTDVYMDGDGRVMVERGDDGSTTIYDEHENPIMKRLADGATEIFDAYQSPKIQLAANGACKIMSQGGGTAAIETKSNGDIVLKTYNGNEIFLDNNGGVTINNKNGESVLYANDEVTSMSTPDGYRCISAYKDDGLIITYHDKDRIALNENEFVLFDSNGDLQIASNEESFNIMQNGRNVITISNNNTHINNQNSNEIFTANDNGITIYDQDGRTSVTFDAALIAKLNNL